MSAGLAASTVTPGSTAPPSSRTTPAIVPLDASCAHEIAGTERRSTTVSNAASRTILSSIQVFVYIGAESSDIAIRMQRAAVDTRRRCAYIRAHAELPSASNARFTRCPAHADVHRVSGVRTGHLEKRCTLS